MNITVAKDIKLNNKLLLNREIMKEKDPIKAIVKNNLGNILLKNGPAWSSGMTLKIVGATRADWKIIIPEISPEQKIKIEFIFKLYDQKFLNLGVLNTNHCEFQHFCEQAWKLLI